MESLWVLWRSSHSWTCLPAIHLTYPDADLCLVVSNFFLVSWASAGALQSPAVEVSSPPQTVLLSRIYNSSIPTLCCVAHILSTGKTHFWFSVDYFIETLSPTLCDPMDHSPLLCPWDLWGKNTGVGCHFLLQEIVSHQGSNPCLWHWQADSLPLSHLGSPFWW